MKIASLSFEYFNISQFQAQIFVWQPDTGSYLDQLHRNKKSTSINRKAEREQSTRGYIFIFI